MAIDIQAWNRIVE